MTKNANEKKDVPLASDRRNAPASAEPSKAVPEPTPEELDAELEEALEQTFPASDPISMESTLVSGRRRR